MSSAIRFSVEKQGEKGCVVKQTHREGSRRGARSRSTVVTKRGK